MVPMPGLSGEAVLDSEPEIYRRGSEDKGRRREQNSLLTVPALPALCPQCGSEPALPWVLGSTQHSFTALGAIPLGIS